MKRKGFTLVELLVVITIIALLMSILMPALAKIKQKAYQVMCATNLSGIGKQILMYGSFNDETYPIAGNRRAEWDTDGEIDDWEAEDARHAYGARTGATVTVTSSLFLLIKYADATAKQFVCKGDAGIEEFKPNFTDSSEDLGIEDAWDFGDGGDAGTYCSYTYHMPYWFDGVLPWDSDAEVSFPISPMSDPGCPLSSDRNPYMDRNALAYLEDTHLRDPEWDDDENAYSDPDKKGNCAAHQRDGQNVLFNDTHVYFEKFPNVGVDNDNIYKYWDEVTPIDEEKQVGTGREPDGNGDTEAVPWTEKDALLVGETN